MARKFDPESPPETRPGEDGIRLPVTNFTIWRTERYPFSVLCDDLGISPRERTLLGFRLTAKGIYEMRTRGEGKLHPWGNYD